MTSKTAPVTRSRDDVLLQVVFAVGLLAFGGGVYVLSHTDLGTDVGTALAAVGAQLPDTVGPALMIAAFAAINFAAGAVLIRAVAGAPFDGWAQAILSGLAGAVVIDTALMAVLGAHGLFRWPVLLVAQLAVLTTGLWLRPIFAKGRVPAPRLPALGPIGWILVGCVWIAPVLLQLASPVVPSNDIGPNHIAPVEHLRVFGGLSSLDLVVSPIYGASRIFLGYEGLLGTLATLGNIEGATAVAAFIAPLAVLLAVGGCSLAGAIAGRYAAAFALVLVPLTVPFLRLTDARATVLAVPLVALTLWLLLSPKGSTAFRRGAVLALVISASIYVHPLIGLFNATTVVLAVLIWPQRFDRLGLACVVAALVAATPQWAAMIGLSFAAATALLALPLATFMIYAFARWPSSPPRSHRLLLAGAALAGVAVLVIFELADTARLGQTIAETATLFGDYTILIGAACVGFVAVVLIRGGPTFVSGVILLSAGLMAGILGSLAGDVITAIGGPAAALDYEVTKTASYFAPTLLAIIGAAGLGVVWSRSNWAAPLRVGIALVIVVLAAAPLRPGLAKNLSLGEHRLSETASISLRIARNGYWLSFPDVRWVVDDNQRQIIDFLRHEIAAGRLTETSNVLQVTTTWRSDAGPSYAMSLSEFAGVVETMAADDAPRSSDSVGGRVLALDDLPNILGKRYPYVVAQTRGLPASVLATLKEHGYASVFGNSVAQVLRLTN